MPLIDNLDALSEVLSEIASEQHFTVRRDTHYDANNLELQWWRGRELNRIDFQPLSVGELAISHSRDTFPLLPRALLWLHNAVPLFPYLARVERRELSRVCFPFERSVVRAAVVGAGGA